LRSVVVQDRQDAECFAFGRQREMTVGIVQLRVLCSGPRMRMGACLCSIERALSVEDKD
jgi:hypothetical protein